MPDLSVDAPGLEYFLKSRQALQGQMQNEQFLRERAALGPDATPEQLIGIAQRYVSPHETLQYSLQSQDKRLALGQKMMDLYDFKIKNMEGQLANTSRRITNEEHQTLLKNAVDQAKNDLIGERNSILLQLGLQKNEIEKLKAGQTGANKPPSGYRFNQNGDLEAIPGGPADTKLQGVLNQDTSTLNESTAAMDRLSLDAQRLLRHPGLSKTTGAMSVVPGVGGLATIPGTEAANFKAGLETLKSQSGLAVLQNLRNMSKTGGALGQVSDFENKLLQANIASLDRAQSEGEFKDSLQRIIDFTDASKDRLKKAYNMKHGGQEGGLPSSSAIDAEIRNRQQRGRRPQQTLR